MSEKETKTEKTEEEKFERFSVILARDLIFMDWTVQFGGQLLGILLAILLGFTMNLKVFNDLFGQSETINPGSYILIYVGTMIAVVGLCVYYFIKLGIRINSPKKIAGKKLNILKIAFFGLSFILGLSYLYNSHLQPAANKIAGIISRTDPDQPVDPSTPVVEIDWKATNEYIFLLGSIILATAVFALLYAGIMYSINKKVNTMDGVAVAAATILLMFYLLSQFSMPQYLIPAFQEKSYSLLIPFFTDLFYYLIVSLVTILVYHLSRRIELTILILFLGFGFGYETSNIFEFLIILKWGFPKDSYLSSTLIDVMKNLQLAGLFGMGLYPIIFYRDTVSFAKTTWKTLRKQGVALLLFFIVIMIIEIVLQFIFQFLGILFSLIIFIVLVGLVNSLITKRYGAQSYTGLMKSMTQATLQMTDPVVPTLRKQSSLLEKKLRRRRITILALSTGIPVVIYFIIMYLATAITSQTLVGTAIFLYTALPISIGAIAFAIAFFFVKNPIPRGRFKYQYPLKVIGLIGGVIYFFVAINYLVYNTVGYYPLIAVFYVPMIILPNLRRDNLGSLVLSLAGDNTETAIKELILRRDLDMSKIEESFDQSPEFIRIWLALVLTKRNESVQTNLSLISMLDSKFPIERATAAMCLLYLNNQETLERLINILENDRNPKVRNSIAYSIRYFENLPEDIYKRVIDSQHYEDDSKVLETLKKTLSELDMKFASREEEEEIIELEEDWEEI
ncbi:MAG: HEAT repeat domain-containing protein [Candidatus Heimdallarchaeota archaeon]|nr:HEAT repeat domain-containing protein [Candidatus Heimdallarchaeota archaeon]